MSADPLLCGEKRMIYDEACLHIKNNVETTIEVQYQTAECYKCSFLPLVEVFHGETKTKIVKTIYGTILNVPINNSHFQNLYFFYQHGHYGINISKYNISESSQILPAANANGPLYALFLTLLIGWFLWTIGSFVFHYTPLYIRLFQPFLIVNEAENDLGVITSSRSGDSISLLISTDLDLSPEVYVHRRIKSLDVFRGITITLMLFVNYGGGKYWIFQHSSWNGITIADLIFPWFAWIMGASLMLSVNSQLRNSLSRKKILSKVFLRSVALCAIGIILNSINDNNLLTLRYPGVLQRLSLAYLMVGSLEAVFITRQNRYNMPGRIRNVEEWFYCWIQWIIMLSLVGLYWLLIRNIPIPGCPYGYLGPGGLHLNSSYANCTGGVVGFFDRQILGIKHLYNGTSISSVYHNKVPFDPEGLLGTLTTAFTVFLGVHASRITLCYTYPGGRLIRWLTLAVILGFLGGYLCGWSKEDGYMPLNKNLWSISFVLVTSSLAFFINGILFFLIDYKSWFSGSPFHQVGKNAILVYIGSIITKDAIPWNFKPLDYTTHSVVLWMNFWSTFLWIITAIFLDLWNK